jgi:hypothetical protein
MPVGDDPTNHEQLNGLQAKEEAEEDKCPGEES